MKIKVTDDIELRDEIRRQLRENGGYCPCSLIKSDDTKCVCKEFLESNEDGYCHCGLYYKEKATKIKS